MRAYPSHPTSPEFHQSGIFPCYGGGRFEGSFWGWRGHDSDDRTRFFFLVLLADARPSPHGVVEQSSAFDSPYSALHRRAGPVPTDESSMCPSRGWRLESLRIGRGVSGDVVTCQSSRCLGVRACDQVPRSPGTGCARPSATSGGDSDWLRGRPRGGELGHAPSLRTSPEALERTRGLRFLATVSEVPSLS